jgi:hypothetical protein
MLKGNGSSFFHLLLSSSFPILTVRGEMVNRVITPEVSVFISFLQATQQASEKKMVSKALSVILGMLGKKWISPSLFRYV